MKLTKIKFGWKNRIRMFFGLKPKFNITIYKVFTYDHNKKTIIKALDLNLNN